jgi:hypothetical protein
LGWVEGCARPLGDGAARLLREPLEVRDVVSGDDHTLVLSGELDMASEDELETAIVSCADAARLRLDLSQPTFMDSTGLIWRGVCQGAALIGRRYGWGST